MRLAAYSVLFTCTATASILFAMKMEQVQPAFSEANDISVETCGKELLSFRAEVKGHSVKVEWNAKKNFGKGHFTLFRSQDGQVYSELARIGVQDEGLMYSFSDKNAPGGINYYRLSQVGQDGKVKVYEPIAVMKDNTNKN
jgi:hypothetical protein